MRRCRLKTVAFVAVAAIVATATGIGGILSGFRLDTLGPDRIWVTGRLTDIDGEPMEGIEVHAIPVSVYNPCDDSPLATGARQDTFSRWGTTKAGSWAWAGTDSTSGMGRPSVGAVATGSCSSVA